MMWKSSLWWLKLGAIYYYCLSCLSYTVLSFNIDTCRSTSTGSSSSHHLTKNNKMMAVTVIKEMTWRTAAAKHSQRIRDLLQPALTSIDHPLNSGLKRQQRQQQQSRKNQGTTTTTTTTNNIQNNNWTALDPKHPVYNFLIEYYGLKGVKGPKRLARWSPDPSLLLSSSNQNKEEVTQLDVNDDNFCPNIYNEVMKMTNGEGGIFLENANENDYADGILHLRGAIPILLPNNNDNNNNNNNEEENTIMKGIVYNPAVFYNRQKYYNLQQRKEEGDDDDEDNEVVLMRQQIQKQMAPFQWYESILRTTLESEPILHCYGLHEWAMQYHPENADPPPSAKYQSVLPLRVSRKVINETVERKGISCTHVDALRFFAPAAGPLNHHGATLERTDQVRMEQKACVHAHMDLLKIVLKLSPFVDSTLLADVLQLSLQARSLDVGASPYDATSYGIPIVPVETTQGRRHYRDQQRHLMSIAEPIRQRVYQSYQTFLNLSFPKEFQITHTTTNDNTSSFYAAPERFAKAEPGGKPWRQNLINPPQQQQQQPSPQTTS